ncbi:MAG: type IV secretion protein IcmO, partial [Pseudomonadota bacterium]|nr:type IV secretion protein IcmO [Pseudomonadota bacterium]
MPVARNYQHEYKKTLRDTRPLLQRALDDLKTSHAMTMLAGGGAVAALIPGPDMFADLIALVIVLYFLWYRKREFKLPLKMPAYAGIPDPNNAAPPGDKKAEGILYLGIDKDSGEELWVTNSDARTHILYLGTTGAGKTEGLKGLVSNGLTWGSGFVYIDGKADTDLFAAMYSLARRFGRDDDLLVLNYMTGNSDVGAATNTLNPFTLGSASYLTNMLVSLMPQSGGDNAMWKERAVGFISSIMPALTWKRDNQSTPLDIRTIRDHMTLQAVVRLARDQALPEKVSRGLRSYLDTLPGFVHEIFDDDGNVVPPSGGGPMPDISIPSQQHGYLAMQFTRSL